MQIEYVDGVQNYSTVKHAVHVELFGCKELTNRRNNERNSTDELYVAVAVTL
jgi:hypothetical protein